MAGALTKIAEDTIKPSERNWAYGLPAELLTYLAKFLNHPDGTLPLKLVGGMVEPVAKTLDRLSYDGLRGLGTGTGMTWRPHPETVDTALTIAPGVGPAARAMKGLPVGMSLKVLGSEAPAASAIAEEAIAKAAPAVSRDVALKRAADQGYKGEWYMGHSGQPFDAIDPSKLGSVTETPAAKLAAFLTNSPADAQGFAENAARVTGLPPNVMNVGITTKGLANVPWRDSWPPIRSEGGQRFLAGILEQAKEQGAKSVRIIGGNDSVSGTSAADTIAVLDPGIMRDMARAEFDPAKIGQNGLTLGLFGFPFLKDQKPER